MALKRIYPEQDTFIVSSSLGDYNYGSDELLEIGMVPDAERPARTLIRFSSDQIKECLSKGQNFRAFLHLNVSEAENLPTKFTVVAATIPQSWEEGTGRVGDRNSRGATWYSTGTEPWLTPGSTVFPGFDGEFAIQGPILHIIDSEGANREITGLEITGGGARTWEVDGFENVVRFSGQEIFFRDLRTDINIDITTIVKAWSKRQEFDNTGFLIRFGDEAEIQEYGARISFYSRETHTIYRPYLEIRWDDATYEPGDLTECPRFYGTFSNNLRSEYTVGDIVQIDLAIKDGYAPRVWTTGSIYQTKHVLPSSSYWGIKDEYTNEMAVNFDPESTRISSNASGSFFILDTGNLEPERYYRLLIKVKKDNEQVIVDNKNIFRVGRNGRH